MDYYDFVHAVEKELNKTLKKGATATIYTATKNNNKKRTGVIIESPGINISPTIYLEEFYRKYQKGTSIEDIAGEVIAFYQQVKYDHSWEMTNIEDYNRVRHNIIFKLVNTKKNIELLKNIPHIDYLDLSMIFCVLIDKNVESTATMMIQKEQMLYWGVSESDLYQHAMENTTGLLPAQLLSMEQLVREMMKTEMNALDNLLESAGDDTDESMYVLTNSIKSMGAACLVYPGILEKISSIFKRGFYVLPSSVHEVILIPDSKGDDLDRLSAMVKDVNETQVEEEDVLSDHAYYYDCLQRKLRMNFQ